MKICTEQFLARQKQAKGLEKQAEAEENQTSEFTYAAVDPEREYGFVAVAAGEGLKAVFGDLGVDEIIEGGQTMNPSTEDILPRSKKRTCGDRARPAQQQEHHHGL